MRSTQGQKYTANLFFGGMSADVDPEMLDPKTGAFLEAHHMRVSDVARNILVTPNGDKAFGSSGTLGDLVFTGGIWHVGYVVEFWYDTVTGDKHVYANGLLIGKSNELPGDATHYLDIDSNNETGELFITDNLNCPIVMDLQDMVASVATQTYFADYDKTLYEINKPIQLNQPIFVGLDDLGATGGLRVGSYAYSMCYSNLSGEDTPWGPATPYIPVPAENTNPGATPGAYFGGVKTYGSEPSLTPSRYGIRIRFRVTNKAGFDFIKLRRVKNNTGQPLNYTPSSEFLILVVDASGNDINIKDNPYSIIDFVDSDAQQWAVLDTSVANSLSTVKRSRTIRYYDRRIVLGGVEYENRVLDDEDIFVDHSDVAKLAFPIVERLGQEGFADINNQVYKKSHRLGEKYGFALKLRDEQGNDLYTIPLKNDSEDFSNYKFPERRSVIPIDEVAHSTNPLVDATLTSNSAVASINVPIASTVHGTNATFLATALDSMDVSIPDFRAYLGLSTEIPITLTLVDDGAGSTLSGVQISTDPYNVAGSLLTFSTIDYNETTDTCTFTVSYEDIFAAPSGIASGEFTNLVFTVAQDIALPVYDPVQATGVGKTGTPVPPINIVKKGDPSNSDIIPAYKPFTPTGAGVGHAGNGNKYNGFYDEVMTSMESIANDADRYGSLKSTVGLSIGGIDLSKIPAHVKSMSIMRTPPAGRVVCQGIAMYSLVEQPGGSTNPSLVKHLDKVWFYSPELDPIIGDKSHLYEDIKNNPSNYKVQLVAPCGFFTDVFSAWKFTPTWATGAPTLNIDMVSMPICGAGDSVPDLSVMDDPGEIGVADYITFGKWRNQSNQGDGITASVNEYIFDISIASDASHGKNTRKPYLSLTLGANIYKNTSVKKEAGTTAQSRAFHEPWYIVNIIQDGRDIISSNINTYNEIGHNIKLRSLIGISNGEADQLFPLVDERLEDAQGLGTTASTYRYIYVDGLPWLSANNISAGTVNTYRAAIESVGSFTPSGGLTCYGLYYAGISVRRANNEIGISFPYTEPSSGDPIVPEVGAEIEIRYNPNSPIRVFLGDTVVGDASFFAVDGMPGGSATGGPIDSYFHMVAPMPQYNFQMPDTGILQANNPETGATHGSIWDSNTLFQMDYIRQWLVYFSCESTVNLPLVFKDHFPRRLYAQRPSVFSAPEPDESAADYLARMYIYEEYNTDYPDEYLNWSYGGFSTPIGSNFDYQKSLPYRGFTKPKSGSIDLLSLMKRIHWSTQSRPGFSSSRVFVPTNVYDLKNDRASYINILYDEFSEKGSNLYVITDRGSGMLLVNKSMVQDAGGNMLTVLAAEGTFIGGEIWLSNGIGCPDNYWRGKSEGIIRTQNNTKVPVLVFPSYNEIMMLSNNNFLDISSNNKANITNLLGSIGNGLLYSVVNEVDNCIDVIIGTKKYSFNASINNWDMTVNNMLYVKSLYSPYLNGVSDKTVMAHVVSDSADDKRKVVISHLGPERITSLALIPSVTFAVLPGLGNTYEFLDLFVGAYSKPYSVIASTDSDFTDSATIAQAKIKTYAKGLYEMKLPRTQGNNVLIGKVLFVKVIFPSTNDEIFGLKWVKTGYKDVVGG